MAFELVYTVDNFYDGPRSAEAVRAKGRFRARPHQQDTPVGVIRELEVEWSSV